jgi:hypothetical protein
MGGFGVECAAGPEEHGRGFFLVVGMGDKKLYIATKQQNHSIFYWNIIGCMKMIIDSLGTIFSHSLTIFK